MKKVDQSDDQIEQHFLLHQNMNKQKTTPTIAEPNVWHHILLLYYYDACTIAQRKKGIFFNIKILIKDPKTHINLDWYWH